MVDSREILDAALMEETLNRFFFLLREHNHYNEANRRAKKKLNDKLAETFF